MSLSRPRHCSKTLMIICCTLTSYMFPLLIWPFRARLQKINCCELYSINVRWICWEPLQYAGLLCRFYDNTYHCNDVIMRAMASQITSLTIIYSTVIQAADDWKHQRSTSLVFVWGIHRYKGPVTRKMFSFDDVILQGQSDIVRSSSCLLRTAGVTDRRPVYQISQWLFGDVLPTHVKSCYKLK